ncbi:hypothetical protein ACFSYD_15535 [Paracoccus aerius]
MADPRFSQNAARLSEDIGDVLTAIRRMIADDDALSSARDSIRADRTGLVQDDAGEFLARRYGGNAALARQMVETAVRPAPAPAVEEVVETPPVPQFILRARPEVVPLRTRPRCALAPNAGSSNPRPPSRLAGVPGCAPSFAKRPRRSKPRPPRRPTASRPLLTTAPRTRTISPKPSTGRPGCGPRSRNRSPWLWPRASSPNSGRQAG